MNRYLEIADHFRLDGRAVSAVSHGGGHINDTFLVSIKNSDNKYILQNLTQKFSVIIAV